MRFVWEKLGLTLSPQSFDDGLLRPWMRSHAQGPSALLLDDRIRIYFSSRPTPDSDGQYVSYSAFVDVDRRDPTQILRVAERPVMGLGQRGAFDEFGVYPFSAIRVGEEIRAYYGGWTRCVSVPFNVGIGVATSHDEGVTFDRIGPGPVLSYLPDEPFILSGPKIRYFEGCWTLFYIAGNKWISTARGPEPVYRIRMATSVDGFHWEREGRDLIPPRIEVDEAQASPDVIFMHDRYHMFFCYRHSQEYRGHAGGYRIGYASSTDLVHWDRDDARAGLDVSEGGWDSEMVAYPHVFEVDGSVYMAYLGNGVGREGFGIARLVETVEE